jgi:eukaryotic-like serine/threonine-protein kinase
MIGQTISHYRILEKIGGGGMGVVYKAEDTKLKRAVALKFLPPEMTRDEEAKQRFVHEAQAASALDHPNICTVHEIDETEEHQIFISMACYDGETLREKIGRGPLKLAEAVDLAIQIALGLAHAHAHDIVHRDIKPANVIVTADGTAKIVDFGLAKLRGGTVLTKSGTTLGTVAYMSPEQVRGEQVDQRTDIWSLGVVLYEMITGLTPFKGEYEHAIQFSILSVRHEAVTGLRSGIPLEVERIVDKCLEKDAAYRYQHVDELVTDLKRVKRDTSEVSLVDDRTASVLAGRSSHAKTHWRKRRVALGGFAAIVILAFGINYFIPKGNIIDSIAVLPFINASDDSLEYLSDGMSESLMNDLSRLPNLTVMSRTSAFHYKGKAIDPQKAGSELGVKGVLWGRISRRGNALFVSAELIDVRKNSHVWGEEYNRTFSDFIALRKELTRKIASELGLRLTGTATRNGMGGSTKNEEAYQLYLKGRFYWNKRTLGGTVKAIEHFQNSISIDPTFAPAYAGLADCYIIPANPNPPKERIPIARSAAKKAIELDESLAEPHATMALAMGVLEWDWQGAEREYKRSIDLNPNYATAHQWYGGFLSNMGRFEEAKMEAQKAIKLDPLSPIISSDAAAVFYYSRDYEAAIRQALKTPELDSALTTHYGVLGMTYIAQCRYPDAMRIQLKGAEMSGASMEYLAALRKAYDKSDWKGFAKVRLEHAVERSKQGYVSGHQLAAWSVLSGDTEGAFRYLQKACDDRDHLLSTINSDPVYDPLRNDARFIALIKKMGFEK